jgi:phosphoglycolate phosphatase-like HAD superfamily hydrolase
LTAHRRAIEAVVFDLDGVLIDTGSCWDDVGIAFVTGMSRRWTEASPEIEIACGYIRAGITRATLNRS